MKFRALFFLIPFLVATPLAQADYLNYLVWTIDEDQVQDGMATWNAARIIAVDKDGNQTVMQSDVGGDIYELLFLEDVQDSRFEGAKVSLDGLSNPEEYSFVIELVNYEYDEATDTETITPVTQTWNNEDHDSSYAALRNSGSIHEPLDLLPYENAWHGSGYMIPEPTGGLLVTLGLALLALRRRKVISIEAPRS